MVTLTGLALALVATAVPGAGAAAPDAPSAAAQRARYAVTATLVEDLVAPGDTVRVTGRVRPAAPRARVSLQQRADGRWQQVSTARLDRRSRYRASVVLTEPGPARLRVVKAGGRGTRAGVSPTRTVTVSTVEPAPETRPLTDREQDHLTAYQAGTGVVRFDAGARVGDVEVGSILAAGYAPATPAGLLRRVTETSRTASGGWRFDTEQASLEDAVGQTLGTEHVTGHLVAQQVTPARGVSVDQPHAGRWTGSVGLPPLDFNLKQEITVSQQDAGDLHGSGVLTVNTHLSFDARAEMTWDQEWFSLKRAGLALHTQLAQESTVSITGRVGGTFEKSLGTVYRVYEFPLGPVVVVVVDSSDIPFRLEGTVDAGGQPRQHLQREQRPRLQLRP